MPIILSDDRRLDRLETWYTDRFRDIAFQLEIKETGARPPGWCFGGRWDLHRSRYLQPWEIRYQINGVAGTELAERYAFRPRTLHVSQRQAELITDFDSKLIMALGSRRAGKSRFNAAKCAVHLVRSPLIGGQMLSPSFPKARIMWRYISQIFPREWCEAYQPSEFHLKTITGAELRMLSTYRADSVIGEGIGWLGLDEAQGISANAWSLALPALSDGGLVAQCWQSGTPRPGVFRARYEDFRAEIGKAIAAGRKPIHRIEHFTYEDNPFIYTGAGSVFDWSRGVMDSRKRRQELEAQFVAEEGLVYYRYDKGKQDRKWSDPRRSSWAPDITREHIAHEFQWPADFVIGVDYGINRNFAVIYKVVKVNGRVGLFVVGEVLGWRDYNLDALGSELVARDFWPALILDDRYGPQSKGGERAQQQLEDIRAPRSDHGIKMGDRIFDVYHRSQNPVVVDRVDAVNGAMEHERWFIDADSAPETAYCLQNQELEAGKPKRTSQAERESSGRTLHDLPDAAGYPVVYLLPAGVDYQQYEQAA